MNINDLIAIVKKKLKKEIIIESIKVEDKSFLHVGHKGNDKKKISLKNHDKFKRTVKNEQNTK